MSKRKVVWKNKVFMNSCIITLCLIMSITAAASFRSFHRLFRSSVISSTTKSFSTLNPNPVTHAAYDRVDNFLIKEYGLNGTLFKHRKSGAQVMSVVAPDDNKVFGITFRTPPKDSTGIAHVLEHSVLCGSRKFPVKEPFVELLKGSLQNFLNAFTYPDRTCYPVASTNTKDFYNLVNVYLDAVLHPRAIKDPQVLQQEGWHYELEKPEDPLTIKGVVYNEMKGVYSSPESLMGRAIQNSLFPHNAYGVDSGGDPHHIPDLTFAQFKHFHETLYHPSNSRIFFYGNDDPLARLTLLDEYLRDFNEIKVSSAVAWQPKFSRPLQKQVLKYPVSDASQNKHMIAVNWLLNDKPIHDDEMMALGVLNNLLLGTSASVLKKTLTESNLGESVMGGGLDTELLQATFSIGMKGVKPEDTEKVEQLIHATLAKVAAEGFESDDIEAAMNTYEFRLREFNTGGYPKGLSVMLAMNQKWIYDQHPAEGVRFEASLASLKAALKEGRPVFQELVKKYLLGNEHRISVEMVPDTELEAAQNARESERLAGIKAGMSEEEIRGVIEVTGRLKEAQQAVDSPEAKATLPSLSLEDINPLASEIETVQESVTDAASAAAGCEILSHPLQTNGILYAEVVLDYSQIDIEDLPLLPLFSRMLRESGTTRYDETQLTRRIGATTGGISVSYLNSVKSEHGRVSNPDDVVLKLVAGGKATVENIPTLFDLIGDVLQNARLDNKKRALEMLKERKASMESAILSRGHTYAAARLSAKSSFLGYLGEVTGGLTAVRQVTDLIRQAEEDWPSLQARLERMRAAIVRRQRGVVVNLTGTRDTLDVALPVVNQFLASLPAVRDAEAAAASKAQPLIDQFKQRKSGLLLPANNEGFVIPSQVNYVVQSGALLQPGDKVSGAHSVVSRFLSNSYLWDHVRVLGGAYGGFSSFSPGSGRFAYLSYRDPNVLDTINVYKNAGNELVNSNLSKEELLQTIIGAVGDLDAPMSPDQKGFAALSRYLAGETAAERQQWRSETLHTRQEDFVEFGRLLLRLNERSNVVVFGSQSAIDQANEGLPEGEKMVVSNALQSK